MVSDVSSQGTYQFLLPTPLDSWQEIRELHTSKVRRLFESWRKDDSLTVIIGKKTVLVMLFQKD